MRHAAVEATCARLALVHVPRAVRCSATPVHQPRHAVGEDAKGPGAAVTVGLRARVDTWRDPTVMAINCGRSPWHSLSQAITSSAESGIRGGGYVRPECSRPWRSVCRRARMQRRSPIASTDATAQQEPHLPWFWMGPTHAEYVPLRQSKAAGVGGCHAPSVFTEGKQPIIEGKPTGPGT